MEHAMPVSIIARPIPKTRVNPRFIKGAPGFKTDHISYVVDAAREMWLIDAAHQLPGWWPGAQTTIVVYRMGNLHHIRVRGIVDNATNEVSGNIPNVPIRYWRCVRIV